MKCLYLVIAVLCFLVFPHTAGGASSPYEQRFAWAPSPETNISSYVLYHTTNSAHLVLQGTNEPAVDNWGRIAVTNTSWANVLGSITNGYLKTNFVAGVTNWVCLTARDEWGVESVPSNVIHFVPPRPPSMLRLLIQTAPTINGPWETFTNTPPVELPMTSPVMFSRILHEINQ